VGVRGGYGFVPGRGLAAHAIVHLGDVGGKSNATIATLVALAYAYEVSLTAFFDGRPTIR
jgi:hypothetical protein